MRQKAMGWGGLLRRVIGPEREKVRLSRPDTPLSLLSLLSLLSRPPSVEAHVWPTFFKTIALGRHEPEPLLSIVVFVTAMNGAGD